MTHHGQWIDRTRYDAGRDQAHAETRAVAEFVAAQVGVPLHQIIGPMQTRRIYRWRAAIVWLARMGVSIPSCQTEDESYPVSFSQLGEVLGGRDHSSMVHALARAGDMRERDPEFRALTDEWLALLVEVGAHGLPKGKPAPVFLPAGRAPTSITRPFALAMTANRKPKNDLSPDDDGALNRMRGSVRLIEAIRREFPGRCAA